MCLSVYVSVYSINNSTNDGSIHMKLEHVVVYENSLDKFKIGHCPIKVKVTAYKHNHKYGNAWMFY